MQNLIRTDSESCLDAYGQRGIICTVSVTSFHRMLTVIVLLFAVIGVRFAVKYTLFRATFDNGMISTIGTLACCGRGVEGNQGWCVWGTANSICCAGEIPLLCSSGSSCHVNGLGHPYCCAKGTTGCNSACVLPSTGRPLLGARGTCNRIAPQGLQTPGLVQYIDCPWDPIRQQYRFKSRAVKMYRSPIILGTRDFTVTVTIIPSKNMSVGVHDTGNRIFYQRMDGAGNGFSFGFYDLGPPTNTTNVITLELTAPPVHQPNVNPPLHQRMVGTLSPGWRQGVPVTVRWIRRNFSLYIFTNQTQIAHMTYDRVLDVDSGFDSSVPFEIGPIFSHVGRLVAVDAYASDLSVSTMTASPPA